MAFPSVPLRVIIHICNHERQCFCGRNQTTLFDDFCFLQAGSYCIYASKFVAYTTSENVMPWIASVILGLRFKLFYIV